MVEVVLSFVAFITGYLILLNNTWDFKLKNVYADTNSFIYVIVCLSTAASFGAFWSYFGGQEIADEMTATAISINKILGLLSVIGFHILSKRVLEDGK